MANPTFQAFCEDVTWTANKSMISLWNASTKVIRLYRIFYYNTRYAAVTGATVLLNLEMLTSRTLAGTSANVVQHDTDDPALDASVYVETNALLNWEASPIQRFLVSTDELTAAEATIDCFHNVMPFGTLWDCGYEDAEVQPLTFRQDEGVHLRAMSTTQGYGDFIFEFTQADS